MWTLLQWKLMYTNDCVTYHASSVRQAVGYSKCGCKNWFIFTVHEMKTVTHAAHTSWGLARSTYCIHVLRNQSCVVEWTCLLSVVQINVPRIAGATFNTAAEFKLFQRFIKWCNGLILMESRAAKWCVHVGSNKMP